MRLDAWLRKDPSLPERLHVVVLLSRAVNDAHGRGEMLAGLAPSHIEVSGSSCDLSDALAGAVPPDYKAPERSGSAPATVASDVYAAGAIIWETLTGRAYAASPSHLSEARNDLPGDLCDAVMACLESSPDWRPADLAYVAELAGQAAAQRGGRAAPAKAPARPATASRSDRPRKAAGRSSPSFDGRGREPSRSQVPLIAAAVVLLAAAGAGYFWMTRDHNPPARQPPVAANRPAAAATPASAATSPDASPTAGATPAPAPAATVAAPSVPVATPIPIPTPTPAARPTSTPTPAPVPVAAVRVAPPEPAPAQAIPAAPATTTQTPSTAPPPAAAAPATAPTRVDAVLATLSPLSVKRPGRVLFDVHGTGLSADLQARLVAVREAPRGMTVVRQKCSGTICNVLVEMDESVRPAVYAIVVEDPQGHQSNALTFTVTK